MSDREPIDLARQRARRRLWDRLLRDLDEPDPEDEAAWETRDDADPPTPIRPLIPFRRSREEQVP